MNECIWFFQEQSGNKFGSVVTLDEVDAVEKKVQEEEAARDSNKNEEWLKLSSLKLSLRLIQTRLSLLRNSQ